MQSTYKVLLITGSFPPAFAPRMGFLCKHIAQKTNWEVDCLCCNRGELGSHAATFSHLDGFVKNVYMYKRDDGIHSITLNQVLKKLYNVKFVYILVAKIFYRVFHRGFNFGVKKVIRNLYAQRKQYDLILTSSGGDRVYEFGVYAAQLFKCPVIHDFRDILEQVILNNKSQKVSWQNKSLLRLRNTAISFAKRIVCVTRGQYDILKEYTSSISLIHNGYDSDIFSPCKVVRNDTFNIMYIGSIYHGQYPIEITCEAFVTFCKKHSDAQVLFYTQLESFEDEVRPLVEKCDESKQFIWVNPCPQAELSKEIEKASILLALHRQSPVECISSKVYEYLAVNRPILYIKNKVTQPLEIIDILQKTNAGAIAETQNEILDFLEDKYREWKQKGFVKGTTNIDEASKYSRTSECDEYIHLIKSVILKYK